MKASQFPPDTVRQRQSPGVLPYRESGPDWQREIYAEGDSGLPDMPMLGSIRYRRAYTHLPEHAHQNCYELCLLEEGNADWMLGECMYELHPGDMFISHPGEFHSGRYSIMQPCRLMFVQISIRKVVNCDAAWPVTLKLLDELKRFPQRRIQGGPACRQHFREMLCERRRSDGRTPLMLRALLNQLLISVLRALDAKTGFSVRLSPGIARAQAFIEHHWYDAPDAVQLARMANLGRSQFLYRFRKETGQTPGALREERRVMTAKTALAMGKNSVTEIAMELGFSTSQYFSTWFKRLTGFSPRGYQLQSRPK